MAWRCSGTTNKQLISNMSAVRIITNDQVAKAMAQVDRANYVRDPSSAYEDSPQPIGHAATISAPHMHAYAASHVLSYLHPGARVLDVGSGSGYLAAVFHHLVGPTGTVVGIEHVDELTKWSLENLRKDGLGEAVDEGKITIVTGDGREGYESGGPYDVIHVGAAAPSTPRKLIEQLASPGRMFIPVGTHIQSILHIDKDQDGKVTETQVMGVSYVPLTDLDKQKATRQWL
ncbi:Protein-L-isoaspartate(D-aspartate) O-methyltransferase [Termitomyces sp. T112]|nr:Protein-L-isoaspartate(D-aspartate) O-methyltransferase [Termitomyces sp. T112]